MGLRSVFKIGEGTTGDLTMGGGYQKILKKSEGVSHTSRLRNDPDAHPKVLHES